MVWQVIYKEIASCLQLYVSLFHLKDGMVTFIDFNKCTLSRSVLAVGLEHTYSEMTCNTGLLLQFGVMPFPVCPLQNKSIREDTGMGMLRPANCFNYSLNVLIYSTIYLSY